MEKGNDGSLRAASQNFQEKILNRVKVERQEPLLRTAIRDTLEAPDKSEDRKKTLKDSDSRQMMAIEALTYAVEMKKVENTELKGEEGGAGNTQLIATEKE